MSNAHLVTHKIHFSLKHKGRREIKPGPVVIADTPEGRVPRISRLLALALRFEGLISSGAIRDQAELADLGYVSRARVSQIMNLAYLAPDIQEAILFLPRVRSGRDPITERHMRTLSRHMDWATQRRMWRNVTARTAISTGSAASQSSK